MEPDPLGKYILAGQARLAGSTSPRAFLTHFQGAKALVQLQRRRNERQTAGNRPGQHQRPALQGPWRNEP